MRTSEALVQSPVTLRLLMEEDITERYLSWFRDPRVTKYIEAKHLTRQECTEYLNRPEHTIYAVEVDGIHIGNVKVGPIDPRHGLSDLVTVIGDASYWGKGYATEAVRQGILMAFLRHGVRKLAAGIHGDNVGSIKAYTRAGFEIEGVLRDHYLVDGKPQDRVCVSAWNPCFAKRTASGRASKELILNGN